jgi:hypothetical protein
MAGKERVLAGFDALLGNGEELSGAALRGYGTINILYDLRPAVGQDLGKYLSWARWNRREAPRDRVRSLMESMCTHLTMGDTRVAIPIPVDMGWLSQPDKLTDSMTGKNNMDLPVIRFNLDAMKYESLRPFGGNVSRALIISSCIN